MMPRAGLLLVLVVCILSSGAGPKTVYVKGYTRKDGTYVRPHYRSPPGQSSVPVVSVPTPGALLPGSAKVEPRTSAPTTPRADARLSARSEAPKSDDSAMSSPPPEDDQEIEAFKKAKLEYESLRALDFAKNMKTPSGLEKWYRQIIYDFPGTDAARESQRRLAGGEPKSLPVPPPPTPPKARRR